MVFNKRRGSITAHRMKLPVEKYISNWDERWFIYPYNVYAPPWCFFCLKCSYNTRHNIFPSHTLLFYNIKHVLFLWSGLSSDDNTQRNLLISNGNHIVFTIFQSIWNLTDNIRLDSNKSKNGKNNLIPVWFNMIPKRFFCVYDNLTTQQFAAADKILSFAPQYFSWIRFSFRLFRTVRKMIFLWIFNLF